MAVDVTKIQKLLSDGKIEMALKDLKETHDENSATLSQIISLSAQLSQLREAQIFNLLRNDEIQLTLARINKSILDLLKDVKHSEDQSKVAFISYNHVDVKTVQVLKGKLAENGIRIIIDSQDMLAGDSIASFIKESIKKSNVTLSIISNNSLLSGWVGLETVLSFYHELFNCDRKYIACYVNKSFFEQEFYEKSFARIEEKILEMEIMLNARIQAKSDIRDISSQYTRLTSLRNNFDEIMKRLRECLCVDVSPKKIEKSFDKILASIKSI